MIVMKLFYSPQVWGGSFFLRKCIISENLMKEHFNITRNRYDLIDDDESKFVEKFLSRISKPIDTLKVYCLFWQKKLIVTLFLHMSLNGL